MTAVVVGICTYRRPQQLTALLTALAGLRVTTLSDVDLRVLVVDDDPAGSAEAVVDAASGSLDGRVTYRRSGSGNLSRARNTVIEEGVRLGEWLVFIDDDCLPDPLWVRCLLEVQQRTGAHLVTGHVVYRTRPGAPAWLLEEPFCDYASYPDGEEPDYGNTANVLMSSRFLVESGVRFRSSLGLTGGEDMTFYSDARAAGAVLRYAAGSRVYEELTPARERLSYHLHRKFWLGNNMVVINRHTHREAMLRLFLRGTKRAVLSLVEPALRVRRGQTAQWRWAVAHSLEGVGLVLGVLGVTVHHRA